MNLLLCTGKDGIQTLFQYKFKTDPYQEPDEAFFQVCPIIDPYEDHFDFSVKMIGAKNLKVTMMKNNEQDIYSAKGITEALIAEAAELFDRVVISSSNNGTPGEFRSADADKVWNRLVQQGTAIYDRENDHYIYTGYKLKNKIDPGYENYEFDGMEKLQIYIDMPIPEMLKIKPLWNVQHYETEKYKVVYASFDQLTEHVDFMELRTDSVFNYQTGDVRYADILDRWKNGLPVSPGILGFSENEKLKLIDGRHRTILAGLLTKEPVPLLVQKEFVNEIAAKLGLAIN